MTVSTLDLNQQTDSCDSLQVCLEGWTNGDCLTCAEHYYGSSCETFCEPHDDSTGHYTCSSSGQKVCLDGWTHGRFFYNGGNLICVADCCLANINDCARNYLCKNGGTCEVKP